MFLLVRRASLTMGSGWCSLLKMVFLCVSAALRAHDWASPVRSLNPELLGLLSCVSVAIAPRLRFMARRCELASSLSGRGHPGIWQRQQAELVVNGPCTGQHDDRCTESTLRPPRTSFRKHTPKASNGPACPCHGAASAPEAVPDRPPFGLLVASRDRAQNSRQIANPFRCVLPRFLSRATVPEAPKDDDAHLAERQQLSPAAQACHRRCRSCPRNGLTLQSDSLIHP